MANAQKRDIDLGLIKVEDFLGDRREYKGVLTLQTDKSYSKGVRSSANVMWSRDDCRMFELCGDFSLNLLHTGGAATQKAIDRQHTEVFTNAKTAEIVSKVLAFYDGKPGIEVVAAPRY